MEGATIDHSERFGFARSISLRNQSIPFASIFAH
jgi:hypothetical protein